MYSQSLYYTSDHDIKMRILLPVFLLTTSTVNRKIQKREDNENIRQTRNLEVGENVRDHINRR